MNGWFVGVIFSIVCIYRVVVVFEVIWINFKDMFYGLFLSGGDF